MNTQKPCELIKDAKATLSPKLEGKKGCAVVVLYVSACVQLR